MMQWFVNECREKFAALEKSLEDRFQSQIEFSKKQIESAEEIERLKGEIKAMKMRMGKAKE
jgi:archaellum component FlaC